MSTSHSYVSVLQQHLERVEAENAGALDQAAALILDGITGDGFIYAGGAGHSMIPVAEAFYRAGGLANVRPIHEPELHHMNGALHATATERLTGIAARALDGIELRPQDVVLVASNSGANPYPVELAMLAKKAGTPVIALTSRACVAAATKRMPTTLPEEATIVLDTLTPVGDVGYTLGTVTTAPPSTIVNGFLWNLILIRLVDLGAERGVSIPMWRSSNVPGGDEFNAALISKYQPLIPQL
ncbi:sugar isomerase domain-containing protein [Pseudonocardiaceae bacterium YIM PH 21723]|nr:sugar isomerase domain-containing protein [Pseudonocardiaceae bacterium YIM PH 21723]